MAARALLVVLCLAAGLKATRGFLSQQSPMRIDCGAETTQIIITSSGARLRFAGDVGYSGGVTAAVPSPSTFGLDDAETTLRYFPTDATSCYNLSVEKGRYLIRLGWAYHNYDGRDSPPRFGVLVQGALVETVDMATVQSQFASGAYYSDYIAFALDGKLAVCLQPLPTEAGLVLSPFLNTLEVLPVDTEAYNAGDTGQSVVLSKYLRMNMGGGALGPEPVDPGHRTWRGDVNSTAGGYTAISYGGSIRDTEGAPDYLPQALFASARQAMAPGNATGFHINIVPVDRSNRWYLRYYFAELNPEVKRGERVFALVLGSGPAYRELIPSLDILASAKGTFSAVAVPVFVNYPGDAQSAGQDMEVGVRTAPGSKYQAVLSGVELYEVIPVEESGDGAATADTTTSSSTGLSGAEIAAIVLGALLGVALLAILAIYISRRRTETFHPLSAADMA